MNSLTPSKGLFRNERAYFCLALLGQLKKKWKAKRRRRQRLGSGRPLINTRETLLQFRSFMQTRSLWLDNKNLSHQVSFTEFLAYLGCLGCLQQQMVTAPLLKSLPVCLSIYYCPIRIRTTSDSIILVGAIERDTFGKNTNLVKTDSFIGWKD